MIALITENIKRGGKYKTEELQRAYRGIKCISSIVTHYGKSYELFHRIASTFLDFAGPISHNRGGGLNS